jgi:hypothetical protein
VISNLIADQTANNPAAVAAATQPRAAGRLRVRRVGEADPVTGSLFIPNITPDFGLSAPFNLMFAFFGQFFDHGLDLVTKGGGTVIMPLKADDPLIAGPDASPERRRPPTNFMAMDRATNLPGPDGISAPPTTCRTASTPRRRGSIRTRPTRRIRRIRCSCASTLVVSGGPQPDGKCSTAVLRAARHRHPRRQHLQHRQLDQVKAQARTCSASARRHGRVRRAAAPHRPVRPLQARPARGMPQLVLPATSRSRATRARRHRDPANALRTGHAFLNDIAHTRPAPGGRRRIRTTAGTSLSTAAARAPTTTSCSPALRHRRRPRQREHRAVDRAPDLPSRAQPRSPHRSIRSTAC